MADEHSGSPLRTDRWPTALASLAVGATFFTFCFCLIPKWLDFGVEMGGAARWRWLAAVPSVMGFSVALRCVWDFVWTGHGSPAPFAPPQGLVIVGFYRHVRNPIYVGGAVGWIGLWLVFGRVSSVSITITLAAVVFYEEPTLRRKFGAEYEEYCRNVHRWQPRMHGWDNPK